MQKKIYAGLSLLTLAALVLAACAPAATPTAPPVVATAPPVVATAPPVAECAYKIGFVTDVGKLNDQSFNEAGWNGVLLAAEQLGLAEECYGFIETADSADYTPNIVSFIDEGYTIIVTSGFAMGAATHQAGKD